MLSLVVIGMSGLNIQHWAIMSSPTNKGLDLRTTPMTL